MKIVYIHGANSSSISFNYIRSQLSGYDSYFIDYDSQVRFDRNLKRIYEEIKQFDDIFFIAHSLGGIYALHLANKLKNKVIGTVSLSTPYGGSEIADWVKFFIPFNNLLKDIGTLSDPVIAANKMPIIHPWLNIVSTTGSAGWLPKPNDGVVTLNSMKYRDDMELVELELNHYEVVLSPKVIDIIKSRLPHEST